MIHFTSKHGAQSLTTSAGHPICTTSGIMLAKELTQQHRLITHEGESAIDAIETTTDEQVVYNLHLSTDDPLADGLEGRSTLYANGVLVGDSQMQWQYEEEYNQRPVNAGSIARRVASGLPELHYGNGKIAPCTKAIRISNRSSPATITFSSRLTGRMGCSISTHRTAPSLPRNRLPLAFSLDIIRSYSLQVIYGKLAFTCHLPTKRRW